MSLCWADQCVWSLARAKTDEEFGAISSVARLCHSVSQCDKEDAVVRAWADACVTVLKKRKASTWRPLRSVADLCFASLPGAVSGDAASVLEGDGKGLWLEQSVCEWLGAEAAWLAVHWVSRDWRRVGLDMWERLFSDVQGISGMPEVPPHPLQPWKVVVNRHSSFKLPRDVEKTIERAVRKTAFCRWHSSLGKGGNQGERVLHVLMRRPRTEPSDVPCTFHSQVLNEKAQKVFEKYCADIQRKIDRKTFCYQ